MGGLKRALRRRRTTPLSALNRQPRLPNLQLGDPDFSRATSPGSQQQYPAAAAQEGINTNRTRAMNQLNAARAAGIDTSTGDFDELRTVASEGFIPKQKSLGETLLGWVGAPFEFTNLAIQALLDPSAPVTFFDYVDAIGGGMEDREEFTKRTGLRPLSFSETITRFGWAPAEEFGPEAVLRGIADFGGSMLIDPLTYLTGGLAGLGRKAAVATGRSAQGRVSAEVFELAARKNLDDAGRVTQKALDTSGAGDYAKYLARERPAWLNEFNDEFGKHLDDIARGNMDNPDVAEIAKYLGGEARTSASFGDDVFKNWEELALANRMGKELLVPLNNRDFAAINALALKELPQWSRGSLRIGPPAFNAKLGDMSIEIPHTLGLGRKLIGNPLRKMSENLRKLSPSKYGSIADAMSSGSVSFDTMRPMLNGLRDGNIAPWQYQILATAADNMSNQAVFQRVTKTMNYHKARLSGMAGKYGQDPDAVLRTVRMQLEQSGDEQALIRELGKASDILEGSPALSERRIINPDPQLNDAIHEAVTEMRGEMDKLHAVMSQLDPTFKEKYIDGYLYHTYTKEGRHIIDRFLSKGANVPFQEWAKAAEAGSPGKGLLARIMNATGKSGQAETNLGGNPFVDRAGRLQALTAVNDGPVALDTGYLTELNDMFGSIPVIGPGGEVLGDVLQTRYPGIDQINEWLGAAARENADAYGIHLPKNWDGTILENNPFDLVIEYTRVMDDTIRQWTAINAMKHAGMIVRRSGAVDMQDVFQKVYANIVRISKKIPAPKGEGKATAQSVLPGRQDLVEGIPHKAIKPMTKAGLDPSDLRGTRELYQVIEKTTQKTFRQFRQVTDDFLPAVVDAPGASLVIDVINDIATIKLAIDPSLSKIETNQLIERALHQIDEAFLTGNLKGRLNHETMVELAQNAPNDKTSDLLHKYFTNKMSSLDDPAREWLGSNPGEYVEMTTQVGDFTEGINELLHDYTARISAETGELLQGGKSATQLGPRGGTFEQRMKGLRTAARDLSDRGYDEAVDIMRNVDDLTGVLDLPDYIKPSDFGLGGPAVQGMVIQRDMALWLKNVARNTASVYTPEGVAAAKLATNQLLRTWRTLATLPRPAFHIRNAVSAAWMNMAIGVRGETYRKLGRNTLKWRKAMDDNLGIEDALLTLDPEIVPAWRAMLDEDILGGFVTAEYRLPLTTAEKKSRLALFNALDVDNFGPTRMGAKAMEGIEDFARAAAFLEYFDEAIPSSALTAREMVHAVHFDYNDLTPLETKIKSIIPFFVWTRRNLPRQLEMMVERPGLIQRYTHLMQSMNDNLGGTDENGLPAGDLFGAYTAGTNFYVNPNTPFWARIMIDPDLPTAELLNIPNPNPPELLQFAKDLFGPHISTLFSINEQREWNDVNVPAPFDRIVKGLAAMGFFDETIDGDVRMPYYMRTIGETAIPFSRELLTPIGGGPTDPNRQQRQGIQPDDSFLEGSLKSLLATLGKGVGIKMSTPVDARSTAYRSQQELNKIIQELRDQGILPPSAG